MKSPFQSSKKIVNNITELNRIKNMSNDSRLLDNYKLLLIETRYLVRRIVRIVKHLSLDKSVYFKVYTLYNRIKQENFDNETTLLATEVLNDVKFDENK